MTPHTVKACRKSMNLSQRAFALCLGLDERTIQRYESGQHIIPEPIQRLILYVFYYGNTDVQELEKRVSTVIKPAPEKE